MIANRLERRLRIAAALVLVALVVEEISLRWRHPTAFLLFAFVSGGLLAIGIPIYLYSILTKSDPLSDAHRPST